MCEKTADFHRRFFDVKLLFKEKFVVERDHDGVEDRKDPELTEQGDDERHNKVDQALIFDECRPSHKKVNDPTYEGKDEKNDLDDLALVMEPSIKIHNIISLLIFYNIIVHTSTKNVNDLTKNFLIIFLEKSG